MSTLNRAHEAVNTALRPLGVHVERGRAHGEAVKSFIPARRTIAEAKRAGMSVGDYIDVQYGVPGTTPATVDAMLEIAGLTGPVERVCEVGAGSGRFMTLVMDRLHPKVYEVYEPADDWTSYLATYPHVVVRPCDGSTLSATASRSVDLVHAQKVLVYLEFPTAVSYLQEMVRVVRPGGIVAFDVITERCLSEETVATWVAEKSLFRPIPRRWVLDFLSARGMTYLGNYFPAIREGITEFMVFRSTPEQQ